MNAYPGEKMEFFCGRYQGGVGGHENNVQWTSSFRAFELGVAPKPAQNAFILPLVGLDHKTEGNRVSDHLNWPR